MADGMPQPEDALEQWRVKQPESGERCLLCGVQAEEHKPEADHPYLTPQSFIKWSCERCGVQIVAFKLLNNLQTCHKCGTLYAVGQNTQGDYGPVFIA